MCYIVVTCTGDSLERPEDLPEGGCGAQQWVGDTTGHDDLAHDVHDSQAPRQLVRRRSVCPQSHCWPRRHGSWPCCMQTMENTCIGTWIVTSSVKGANLTPCGPTIETIALETIPPYKSNFRGDVEDSQLQQLTTQSTTAT